MQPIGILGGMSWESTVVYYQLMNRRIQAARGGLHSAPILMHSFDFQSIADMQTAGDWDGMATALGTAAHGLAQAGARAIVIATNTMHKLAPQVEAACGLPVLHIADATAAAIKTK